TQPRAAIGGDLAPRGGVYWPLRLGLGRGDIRHHHRVLQRWQAPLELTYRGEPAERLARVRVSLYGEEHLGLDLGEAVEHGVHAEVGRAARPDGAHTRCGQKGDGRFGDVRHVADDAVA